MGDQDSDKMIAYLSFSNDPVLEYIITYNFIVACCISYGNERGNSTHTKISRIEKPKNAVNYDNVILMLHFTPCKKYTRKRRGLS